MPPKKAIPKKISSASKKTAPKKANTQLKKISSVTKKKLIEEIDSDVSDDSDSDNSDVTKDEDSETKLSDIDGESDESNIDESDIEEDIDNDNDDEKPKLDLIETTTKLDEDIIAKTTRIRKIIPHDKRTSSDRMTRFEFANIMANRAKHIQMGAEIFIDIENMDKEEDIALKEIMTLNKKTGKSNCELYISRYSHSDDNFDYYEEWFINEMILPNIN